VRRFSAAFVFSSGQRKTRAAEKRRTPKWVPYLCPPGKFVSAARLTLRKMIPDGALNQQLAKKTK